MNNNPDSRQKSAHGSKQLSKEVLGPLTVLAEPIYAPNDEACPTLLAAMPNGLAVAIDDAEYFSYTDYPVSIFRHLHPGDVIVCTAAIRVDSWDEYETGQVWERMYEVRGLVYQLVDGKAIDLIEELMGEIREDEPDEAPVATVLVQ